MGSFRGQPKSILYESMPGKVLSGSPSSLFASLSGWPMSILRSTRSSHILPRARILAFSQAAESNDLLLPHAANKQTNAVTTQPVILRRTRVLIMAHPPRVPTCDSASYSGSNHGSLSKGLVLQRDPYCFIQTSI